MDVQLNQESICKEKSCSCLRWCYYVFCAGRNFSHSLHALTQKTGFEVKGLRFYCTMVDSAFLQWQLATCLVEHPLPCGVHYYHLRGFSPLVVSSQSPSHFDMELLCHRQHLVVQKQPQLPSPEAPLNFDKSSANEEALDGEYVSSAIFSRVHLAGNSRLGQPGEADTS